MSISEISGRRYILTDIDDTVLECAEPLQKFIEEKLGIKAHTPLRDMHFIKDSFNLSISEIEDIVKQFWDDPIFGTLNPEPCAKIIIPKLVDKGYTFIGISSCHSTQTCKELRGFNVNKWFLGAFEYIFHTWPNGKAEYLELPEYKNSIWVEDNLNNALFGASIGHKTFLLDRPHNAINVHSFARVIRVQNWHDIYQILEGTNS